MSTIFTLLIVILGKLLNKLVMYHSYQRGILIGSFLRFLKYTPIFISFLDSQTHSTLTMHLCEYALHGRGGSRAAATSKMERFLIMVNGFQPLTIITKRSILDIAAVLDPPRHEKLKFHPISSRELLWKSSKFPQTHRKLSISTEIPHQKIW